MNYDFSLFHPECGDISIQPAFDGKMYLYCPKCRVLADVEAVSMKTPAVDVCLAAKTDRTQIGKQTANIHKGSVKP